VASGLSLRWGRLRDAGMVKPLLQMLLMVGWTFLGIILIYVGLLLFDRLSPIDYRAEIRRGNVAAGVVLGAVILAIAAVVVAVLST
jgi:uncharacterized membrane protein YjfL (UPF0719 family)